MRLQQKEVTLPMEEMFSLFEFWLSYYRLKEAGAKVVVVDSGSSRSIAASQEEWLQLMYLQIKYL